MGVIVRDSTWTRGSYSLLSCKPALGSHSYWTCSIPDKVVTGQIPASTAPLKTAMGFLIPLHVPPTPPQPSHHQPITRKINPRLPSLMSWDSSRVFLKASIISLKPPQSPRMTMVFLVLVHNLATHHQR